MQKEKKGPKKDFKDFEKKTKTNKQKQKLIPNRNNLCDHDSIIISTII